MRVDGFRIVQGGWLRLSLKSVASDAGVVSIELARSQVRGRGRGAEGTRIMCQCGWVGWGTVAMQWSSQDPGRPFGPSPALCPGVLAWGSSSIRCIPWVGKGGGRRDAKRCMCEFATHTVLVSLVALFVVQTSPTHIMCWLTATSMRMHAPAQIGYATCFAAPVMHRQP